MQYMHIENLFFLEARHISKPRLGPAFRCKSSPRVTQNYGSFLALFANTGVRAFRCNRG